MIKLLKILTLFIGISAIVGAVMMWTNPMLESWGGELLLDPLKEKMPWPDVFFRNFIPSGFVLFLLIGIPQLVASFLLFKKHCYASYVAVTCGIILILWTTLEWWIWGFNPMSNLYFVLGLVETVISLKYDS